MDTDFHLFVFIFNLLNFFSQKKLSFHICRVSPARDFDVEGVTDPQQSMSQLKGKGQGVEPVWSTQLSPDSACSEGSAGSLEPPPDAGQTDVGSCESMESVVMVILLGLCSSVLLSRPLTLFRHRLSESRKLRGQFVYGGRRGQELPEESL